MLAGDGDFGIRDDVGSFRHPQGLIEVVATKMARRDDEAA
jgi:hypothetical protein